MADVLIYWRDYAANWAYLFAEERAFYWHSSAKCIAELQLGDRAAKRWQEDFCGSKKIFLTPFLHSNGSASASDRSSSGALFRSRSDGLAD